MTLLDKQQIGVDEFRRPVYTENPVQIENVLVSPMSDQEVLETLNLTGRKATYQLAIPKGDAHIWTGRKVQFFGATWRVIGLPVKGIDELIPLDWNMKVTVESCNGKCDN